MRCAVGRPVSQISACSWFYSNRSLSMSDELPLNTRQLSGRRLDRRARCPQPAELTGEGNGDAVHDSRAQTRRDSRSGGESHQGPFRCLDRHHGSPLDLRRSGRPSSLCFTFPAGASTSNLIWRCWPSRWVPQRPPNITAVRRHSVDLREHHSRGLNAAKLLAVRSGFSWFFPGGCFSMFDAMGLNTRHFPVAGGTGRLDVMSPRD